MKRHFVFVLFVLIAIWLLSLPAGSLSVPPSGSLWPLRGTLIRGTGFLAICCMAIAMILAARPVRLEPLLGGLDQFYRLHKRLGVAGALFGLAHWLLEIVPKWMVGQGWLSRPNRGGAGGSKQVPFESWHDPAKELGEWGLYLILALVVVALWKRVPYRHFARLHRLTPVAYLLLVFHSIVFIPLDWWRSAAGPFAALLMAGGVFAAILSLIGRIGFSRRALGHVESLRRHEDRVLEVHCQLETPWGGHESGQFVFATFHPNEGAHPFTVVSSWAGDGHLVLAIKGLGDYTKELPDRLAAGDAVVIEGPYGRFNFEGPRERQIWVAGGIGITPFISRMEQLARGSSRRRPVDLFYSTNEPGEPLMTILRDLAARTGVTLHVVVPPRDGYLTADRLSQAVAEPHKAEVWFCGPNAFGDSLRKGLERLGLPTNCFHQEAFEMR
ncbi:MAG TPA: ferric reductase-like transmembrane domain-containing protein [Burkholderiaceae bacterium]|nr:ferric reductase-like transmembrane domain-containing protein [Burkholderiaceae bacterium]